MRVGVPDRLPVELALGVPVWLGLEVALAGRSGAGELRGQWQRLCVLKIESVSCEHVVLRNALK